MSVVTGVTLIASYAETPSLFDTLNAWLNSREFGDLKDVSEHGGGSKHPQIYLYSSGYNHFDCLDAFVEVVMNLNWDWPEEVVLTIHHEDTHRADVHRPPSESSAGRASD